MFATSPMLVEFVLGASIATVVKDRTLTWAPVLLPLGVVGLFVGQVVLSSAVIEPIRYGIPSAFVLFGAVGLERLNASLFTWVLPEALGAISYSLYLVHTIVLKLFGNIAAKLPLPGIGQMLLDLGVTIAAAILCYKFVELPLVKLFTKWLLGKGTRPPEPELKT